MDSLVYTRFLAYPTIPIIDRWPNRALLTLSELERVTLADDLAPMYHPYCFKEDCYISFPLFPYFYLILDAFMLT